MEIINIFFMSSLIFSLILRCLENNAARSPRRCPERNARWEIINVQVHIIMFYVCSK